MDRVGATTRDVAAGSDVNQSTVVRVKNGSTPKADTAFKLLSWAKDAAQRKRIPKREWLTLEDLLYDTRNAA